MNVIRLTKASGIILVLSFFIFLSNSANATCFLDSDLTMDITISWSENLNVQWQGSTDGLSFGTREASLLVFQSLERTSSMSNTSQSSPSIYSFLVNGSGYIDVQVDLQHSLDLATNSVGDVSGIVDITGWTFLSNSDTSANSGRLYNCENIIMFDGDDYSNTWASSWSGQLYFENGHNGSLDGFVDYEVCFTDKLVPVPEPLSILLLASGLLGFSGVSRGFSKRLRKQ